jgi:predicted metal-dependent peptidase
MIPEEEITLKIKKKNWKIRIVKSTEMSAASLGECDHPEYSKPEIWVKRTQKPLDLMDTVIHEVLHAVRPELSEEAVLDTATTIAKALWKLNYRKMPRDMK